MRRRPEESDAELGLRLRADPVIAAFEALAREYCAWVLAEPAAADVDVHILHSLLSRLYAAGVQLPREPEFSESDIEERDAWPDALAMLRRKSTLPFQYYWATLNAVNLDAEAKVGTGDLADDVEDIWCDLARGLLHWDAGEIVEAVWTWSFHFQHHWGEHAADAIRALHEWLVEDSDRWTPPTA